DLLPSCYRTALALAAEQGLSSIAFPAISTGVYRFPPERAARIAVGTVGGEVAHAPRGRSEEHTSALQSHRDLHSFPTRRSSDLAFPAISTGVYRFPPERAARIAVGTVAGEVAHAPRGITRVVFCCFSPASAEHHKHAFTELGLA